MAYGCSCCVGNEQMKLITLISVSVLITIILTSWGTMINDLEETYVDTGISKTTSMNQSFMETYNRQKDLNTTFSSLHEDLNALGSDAAWYEKLGTGMVAMFKGFISLPRKILTTMANLATDGTAILIMIGIPKKIVYLFGTIFTAGLLFFLIELIRRYPV